jgi:Tfp pilus assembly protein PilF
MSTLAASFLSRAGRLASGLLALLLMLLWAAPAARAQGGNVDSAGTGGRHAIQGRLVFPSGKRADVQLRVRLESTGFGDLSVISDLNGTFSFRSLKAGSYTVVVVGGDDFETVRETVFIEPSSVTQPRNAPGTLNLSRPYNIQIYLRPKRPATEMARPGVLNAALASVPKPAAELYEKAVEAARRGTESDFKRAVEHLKAALALHPEFALALSEMGVLYMKMKQPEKAAEAVATALKLEPDDYASLLTYGRALFDLQRFDESEEQFRRALTRNNSSPTAHFYTGLLRLKRRDLDSAEKSFTEAIKHGGDQMGLAHKYLGGIYWGRKEYGRAADSLETYLRLMPDAEDASKVRATIKDLRARN